MNSTLIGLISVAALLFNVLVALLLIFIEKKDPGKTWAWLMVMLVIPYIGFVLYWALGFDIRKHAIFTRKRVMDDDMRAEIRALCIPGLSFFEPAEGNELARLNMVSSGAALTKNNRLRVFNEGNEKFGSFLEDIGNAKTFIHMLYYIFRADSFGEEMVGALAKRASEGVEVRLIIDGSGLGAPPRRLFRPLLLAGGLVSYFAPRSITRINYRNHRKVAVIDGAIGYIGGLNIGNEYLGRSKRFGFWRDTHIRITGDAVKSLEARFIMDWNFSRKDAAHRITPSERYFLDAPQVEDGIAMQIVSSGPDTKWSSVFLGFSKMITEANRNIYIQSPYFVPDESIFESLRIAALSGVDVRILIPGRPDHPFVYWAALSYMGELLKAGVRCYTYQKGFMHTKAVMIDGEAATVGTANMDIRSFRLNLEINAFIYDRDVAAGLEERFLMDLGDSRELTLDAYNARGKTTKIKESFSRLLSPLL